MSRAVKERPYMIIIIRVRKFYRRSTERRREDSPSLREAGAAFLLVTFCKLPWQYKMSKANPTFCDQSADVSSVYTVIIKCVSTFTQGPCCSLWSLKRRWRWPMTKGLWTTVSWRRFRDSYMRRLLNYLINRCTFYLRWTLHVSQLSLCLLESGV